MTFMFAELVKHQTLIKALVTRQLAARYRGSVLGFLWSFLNPLVLMLVYTIVFQHFTRVGEVQNYSLYLFAGLLPWLWTTSALNEGTSSLTSSGHLITKSMFPPHLLPFTAVLTTGIHFLLTLPLFFGFAIFLGVPLTLNLLFLPALILLHGIFLFGIILGTASLNVRLRDMQHVVANALTILFFLCPIIYSLNTVPERFQHFFKWNPLAQITMLYHYVLLGEGSNLEYMWAALAGATIIALIIGIWIFERGRERFAEYL